MSNTVAKSLGVDELGKCGKDDIVARTVDRDAMDVSVGRTIWEGGKRRFGRLALMIPSASPLSRHIRILAGTR